jgi:hypothetical protein
LELLLPATLAMIGLRHRDVDLDQPPREKDATDCQGQALRGETQMGILSWIIPDLIAGFIGSKIVNRQGQGFWL